MPATCNSCGATFQIRPGRMAGRCPRCDAPHRGVNTETTRPAVPLWCIITMAGQGLLIVTLLVVVIVLASSRHDSQPLTRRPDAAPVGPAPKVEDPAEARFRKGMEAFSDEARSVLNLASLDLLPTLADYDRNAAKLKDVFVRMPEIGRAHV